MGLVYNPGKQYLIAAVVCISIQHKNKGFIAIHFKRLCWFGHSRASFNRHHRHSGGCGTLFVNFNNSLVYRT